MRSRRDLGHVLVRHVLPALLAVLFVVPVLVMLSGSLRPLGALPPTGVEVIPPGATLQAFGLLDDLLPIRTYLANSVIVAVIAVPLSVAVAAMTGFGIRLLEDRRKRLAILAAVAVMLVPTTALWATRFRVYSAFEAIGTLVPLIAPALLGASPFLVLIYAWAFHGIPDSQLHAARLEGASSWRIFLRIALPQVRTATVAVAILAFTFHWGNFVDALLYLRGQEQFTLPLGLDTLKLLRPTEFPLLMAGAVVFTLPSIIVFLFANRIFDDPLRTLRGDQR